MSGVYARGLEVKVLGSIVKEKSRDLRSSSAWTNQVSEQVSREHHVEV